MELSIRNRRRTFRDIQYEFTRRVRDPENQPVPEGLDPDRMQVYCELVYNNVERVMSNMFPVLRKITPDERWHALVRDFFKNHKSHSPFFSDMPQEFLKYLQDERDTSGDPPFILELVHYEWVEYAISIDPKEIDWRDVDPTGDLLAGVPVISPVAWPLRYQYPVHKISPTIQPQEPPDQPTYIVVYRDLEDKVGFIELNPVSARLLELIRENSGRSGRQLLGIIAAELGHPNPEVVEKGGLETMERLRVKSVLLGTRK
jgi:hypothetical protein